MAAVQVVVAFIHVARRRPFLGWPACCHPSQVSTSRPTVKRLWREIVVAKIRMQGAVLASVGQEAGAFDLLAGRVRAGDPENLEAQAARRYWRLLMGDEFRRDRDAEGINALLNYGYTVLRATVARAICAAGLHPTIGLHHIGRGNAFALADDLMEPYRPLVERCVVNIVNAAGEALDREAKAALAALTSLDLTSNKGQSPLHLHAVRLAQQLSGIFQTKEGKLDLPVAPEPLVLAGLGKEAGP